MRTLLFLLSASLAVAQAPFTTANIKLLAPPVQGTPGNVTRILSINPAGLGETVTPLIMWDSIVQTGLPSTNDLLGFTALGRSLVDDPTTAEMQNTLGASTVGKSFFTTPNPNAITYPRVNADNSVTYLTPAAYQTALGYAPLNNPTFTGTVTVPTLSVTTAANIQAMQVFGTANFAGGTSGGVLLDSDGGSGMLAIGNTVTIASATTIAPTKQAFFVSGVAPIVTITPPAIFNAGSSGSGQITIIPTGIFTTTTGGNIALASTAVVGKALIMTWMESSGKWYPSY